MISINNWNCKNCKGYNDVLNNHCKFCHSDKPLYVTSILQAGVEIQRDIFFERGFTNTSFYPQYGDQPMTEQEKLFAKFFSEEKILVADMNDLQLREHREELSKIAFEAKARLTAASDEERERSAKNPNSKQWLVSSDSSINVSDSINGVKIRAARMSKMDKMKKQLQSAGLPDELVNEMINKMEKTATENNLKTVTFNKSVVKTASVTVEKRESTLFDVSKLKFN